MDETVKQMFWLWTTKISERLAAFNKFKEQTKQNTFSQNIDKNFSWLESVYVSWQTATNPQVREQANDIVRKWELAMQIRNYAASQWKDRSSWTDPQVINTMASVDPKFKEAYLAFKDDPTNTDTTGFAMNMWWIKPEQETEEWTDNILPNLGALWTLWLWYEAATAWLGGLSSWAWKKLYGMSFNMKEDEANSIQRDNVNKIKMDTYDKVQEEALEELKAAQKAWDEAAIEAANRKLKAAIEWHDKAFEGSKTPTRRTVDTALEYDIAWINKADMWDKAKAEWELLFEQELAPALRNSKQTVNVQELIDSINVEDLAKWDPMKREAYSDALEALKEAYSDPKYAEYSMMDTQTLKSWIQGRTPQKFYKNKEITNELQELNWILGSKLKDALHSKLSAELWEDTAKLYLDYANLMDIAKAWVKDRANSLSKWGFGGFQNWVKDKAVTPVSSYGWKSLKTIGDWLKGKSIKNIATKLIKKWWIFAIFEDGSLIPWSPTNIASKAQDLREQYNKDPNSVYTSDTSLWNAVMIYDKEAVDKAIKMAQEEWAPEWLFYDMYWSPHVLEEWVIYDVY